MPETPYADMTAIRRRARANPAEIFRDGRAWIFLLSAFMNLCFQNGVTTWLPRYCSEVRGYGFTAAGLMVTVFFLGALIMRLLSPLAEGLGVTLRCEPEPGCIISASEDDVYQIVFNLAENAVKYNVEGGSVDIRVRRGEGRILLDVEDTGIGIPEADLPNIFSRFYRVDKARSREKGGSGLGLSIVHDAVTALGGSITVEAREGGGTRFSVSFPEPGEGAQQ